MSASSRMQAAKSTAVRLSVTFTLRQGRWTSTNTNRLAVPLRRYSQSYRSSWPGLAGIGVRTSPMSWVGLSSKQTTGRFGSGIGRLGIEIEHVLHPGNVFSVDLWNAPHVLAPRLQIVFGQAPAHGFPRDALACGEPGQFTGQKLQGPTRAPGGRARTGRRDQQGFLFAGKLTARARARLFVERRRQVAEHKAALGPVYGRAADADASGDLLIAGAAIRRQQNLRAFELARPTLAAAQQSGQLVAFALVEFDPIAYIHPCLLWLRLGPATESDGQIESPV